MSPLEEVSGPDLRRIAGLFATGVSVVTSSSDGVPCGITVNSFASVSLDPPLVLICVALKARSYRCIDNSGRFAVNVLSEDQEPLARLFASLEEDKFTGLSFHTSPSGSPLLEGIHAWLDCEVVARHGGGRTHTIFLGRVVALSNGPVGRPLVFHAGGYTRLDPAR